MESTPLQQEYKGYRIYGSAEPVHNNGRNWFATARVLLTRPNHACVEVDRFQDSLLTYEDENLAKVFGLFVAEVAVDQWIPPPAYYLTPMNLAWAVDIVRRAAEECMVREIRRPKLYEALDFLEQELEPRWLIRRYRRELIGDRREYRQKQEMRKALRFAVRGIQQACAALIVDRMNELALHFRENKAKIDNLRGQLTIVRKPVRR